MKRDVITINDLSNAEIDEVFDLADEFSAEMASEDTPYRVRGRRMDAQKYLLANLFFEPSTRTRFSFETAMIRLGGNLLGGFNPLESSASKGESIADTVRVMQNYVDLIVIRHPYEGTARAVADFVDIPVINGGDGRHEHPTQTLCDLYTLRRENRTLQDLNVLLVGDLRNGRTVHSLAYALARFKANIITLSAEGLELPDTVNRRLKEDYGCTPVPGDAIFERASNSLKIGVVYMAEGSSLQQELARRGKIKFEADWEELDTAIRLRLDVCYVTRLQGERLSSAHAGPVNYPVIDKHFLADKRFDKDTRVMHPLPRVNELGYDLDQDPRGVYFKQAGYGVPVRMALIAKVLGIRPFRPHAETHGPARYRLHSQRPEGQCPNERCIVRHAAQLHPRFLIVKTRPFLLRCYYCETEFTPSSYGNTETRALSKNFDLVDPDHLDKIIFFASDEQGPLAGFHPASPRHA
jgi:aspartate carbamoyltransferase catalytic subunit